jgi:hypothetical protein
MCHPVNPQWTVRNSTAAYLGRIAEQGILPDDASAHVRRAAGAYRAAYRAWQEAYKLVGYAGTDGAGRITSNRVAAAQAVRRAAEHERGAIAELRQALEGSRPE